MMGRGILLSGVPGNEAGKVKILGGGVVGMNAAKVVVGLEADVVIMDVNLDRLRYLDEIMPPNVRTIYSHPHAVAEYALSADLIIRAVLIPDCRTPILVRRELLQQMKNGAVVVDVGIDQGGCVETSRPTTRQDPTFITAGVVHYCVTNMPGAVGRTSIQALCHATQPYVLRLASGGVGPVGLGRSGLRDGSEHEGRPSDAQRRGGGSQHADGRVDGWGDGRSGYSCDGKRVCWRNGVLNKQPASRAASPHYPP